jgi:hypothetical protein
MGVERTTASDKTVHEDGSSFREGGQIAFGFLITKQDAMKQEAGGKGERFASVATGV